MPRERAVDHVITTIIPTFKGDFRLARAVNSVLSQTYKGIVEVIVVDDNPPKSEGRHQTERIMQAFVGDERVRYVRQKTNQGGAQARNTGIALATGAYVCFLDDDDYFMPDKLAIQARYLDDHSEVAGVSCHFEKLGVKVSMDIKSDYTREILLLIRAPHTSSLMMRKVILESLRGFDVSYARHQDYEFLIRFFRSNTVHVVDEVLVAVDSTGNSNNAAGPLLESLKSKLFSDFATDIQRIALRQPGFYRVMYSVHYSDVVFAYLRSGDVRNAIRVSWGVIRRGGVRGIGALSRRAWKYVTHHTFGRRGSYA